MNADLLYKTISALEEEGMTLSDYESGAVLVFVDGQLLSDSDTEEESKVLLERAKGYGETGCWMWVVS